MKKDGNGCGKYPLQEEGGTSSDIKEWRKVWAGGQQLMQKVPFKDTGDCEMVSGETVAKQHWITVCRITLEIKKRK